MIVVKLEIWPRGNKRQAREIDRMFITNEGGRTLFPNGVRYEYSYRSDDHAFRAGKVHHIREDGAWELVRKALEDGCKKFN